MITQQFKVIEDIKVFYLANRINQEDYNEQGLNNLFDQEEKHFWFISRKKFILQSIMKFISKDKKIIDIGSGTGNVLRYLKQNGYQNIAAGEMHFNGLKYAKSYGIKECLQFNLLDMPFENEFDCICMFDVLEHIENDFLALENVYNGLKKGGKIILTVPSHMWLWNRDDSIAGHKRRYTKKLLEEKLHLNNFEIKYIRYFFIFITPLLYLRAILNKDDYSIVTESELYNIDISINPVLNSILLFISRIENKINNILPNIFGGSLLIVAEKK